MFIGKVKKLTDLARFFLEPANATHRQYEALRAYFVDELPCAEAARRFGYTPESFRVLVHRFRQDPPTALLPLSGRGPQAAPKTEPLRDLIIALRKQNLSIYDISRPWPARDTLSAPWPSPRSSRPKVSHACPAVRRRTPTRLRPTTADVADVRQLDLNPAPFRTQFGGLFLFLPILAAIPFDRILRRPASPARR